MFCHQCQETMRNQGCNAARGVCGKTSDVADLQDLVLYACKGIGFWATKALEKGIYNEEAAFFVDRMLFATITNANFSAGEFTAWILEALKRRDMIKAAFLKAGGASGDALPGAATWTVADAAGVKAAAAASLGGWLAVADEDRRSLESLVLYGLKGMAAYLEHAYMLGKHSKDIFVFMLAALATLADKVVDAVKSGAIKRFVVMAGCDARQPTRAYYTDVAKALPGGTIILTAGCAKYRYNKLALGDVGGIPRVLDAGQCNDSYSLALVALKLKEIFDLDDVNKLPLSFDIAWYEQKAVLVLLALLSLGFKNIRLGPTLPGFLSPGVAKTLVGAFGIKGIETADKDVAAMMAGR